MSKGLEALEEIKYIRTKTYYVLELELDDKLTEDLKIIEKELKALEIIKNKKVDVYIFLKLNTFEEYNKWYEYDDTFIPLTQEEYELLKEVLL